MSVTSREELHGVVAENGDLVVPSSELDELNLVPGQRVPVTVTKPSGARRRNIRGVLAGKVSPLSYDDFEEVSREVTGECARG